MKKRILLYSILIILVSVAITATVSVNSMTRSYLSEKSLALSELCRAFSAEVRHDEDTGTARPFTEYASEFAKETGFRVTFIDRSGKVLADSEAGAGYADMDNHGGRQEVRDALDTGFGKSDRDSGTFDAEYLYVAVAEDMKNSGRLVTRLSMKVDKAAIARNHASETALPSAAIGIILALVFALLYSRKLTRPIRRMEEQLQKLLEENRKAEDIRREFVANVTHELKTPLTSISGFVETLQRSADNDPEVRKKFLGIISVESARLARLIDDILIISDMENGRETPVFSDVNVKAAIEETIGALEQLAESKDITIEFNCEYEMYIGGDTDRFKQMMVNLLENAIKYSEPGKCVWVDAEKIAGAGAVSGDDKVVIRVRDEGIGIAEEHLGRLFERFYRVDKSRSKNVGGTGLGLAIVKHIAALYDAELEVESKVGEGSVFTVTFRA
jgi:two-component system phosphate regulon sensor histidine kinase PhoR